MGAHPCGLIWEIEGLVKWCRRPYLSHNPVACRWRAPRSRIWNPSHVFFMDELDRMHVNQFVWQPCSDRILRDYPLALRESELSHRWSFSKLLSGTDLIVWCDSLGCSRVSLSLTLHGFDQWGHFFTTEWSVQHASLIALWNSDTDMSSQEYHPFVDARRRSMYSLVSINQETISHSSAVQQSKSFHSIHPPYA